MHTLTGVTFIVLFIVGMVNDYFRRYKTQYLVFYLSKVFPNYLANPLKVVSIHDKQGTSQGVLYYACIQY